MKGKTVLVTGATSGIGKAAAIELSRMGATVVFNTRDEARGIMARNEIVKASGNEDVHVLFCDLASLDSVRKFCNEYKTKFDRLDVLVNNAGQWDFHRRESPDGIENIWATNFLAPFLMTHLLLPILEKSAPARIISTSSGLHGGAINFDDIEFKRKFSGMKAYRQSKLALILFTRELARRLKVGNKPITANSFMPGMVATNLGRDSGAFMKGMFKLLGKSPEKGAGTLIYLATSPEAAEFSGENFAKKKVAKSSKESHNMDAAARLWALAEKYTGL